MLVFKHLRISVPNTKRVFTLGTDSNLSRQYGFNANLIPYSYSLSNSIILSSPITNKDSLADILSQLHKLEETIIWMCIFKPWVIGLENLKMFSQRYKKSSNFLLSSLFRQNSFLSYEFLSCINSLDVIDTYSESDYVFFANRFVSLLWVAKMVYWELM